MTPEKLSEALKKNIAIIDELSELHEKAIKTLKELRQSNDEEKNKEYTKQYLFILQDIFFSA